MNVAGLPADTYTIGATTAVREGGLVAVTFDVTCVKAAAGTCGTEVDFSQPPAVPHPTLNDASAMVLRDPADKSTRPVVVDDAFMPLSGGIGPNTAPGVTAHVWVYFAPVSGGNAILAFPYGGPSLPITVS